MMNGKYMLHPLDRTEFHWSLKAPDAQTMLSSQVYPGKAGAETGIESCRVNSQNEDRYERLTSNSRYYFVLRAPNGDLIGTSETYPTVLAREKGIALCKESGPFARTTYASP
jgi:uncharacterized protein YegP (UPF0339 family)